MTDDEKAIRFAYKHRAKFTVLGDIYRRRFKSRQLTKDEIQLVYKIMKEMSYL